MNKILEEIQQARNNQLRWDKDTTDREYLTVVFQILSQVMVSSTRENLVMLAAVIVAWIETIEAD
jgi:hypothetical protein